MAIFPACYTASPFACVCYSCLALFGLELTVGVSWAIPLDIGGHCAGSVAAVMNTCGNLAGAIASAATAYIVKLWGWNAAFLLVAGLCGVAAIIHLWIRADQPLALPA